MYSVGAVARVSLCSPYIYRAEEGKMTRKTLEAIVVAAALVAVFLVSSGVAADDFNDERPDFIDTGADLTLSCGMIVINHVTIALNIASAAYRRHDVTSPRSNRSGVGKASIVLGGMLLTGAVVSAVDMGAVDYLYDALDSSYVPLIFDVAFAIHGIATIALGVGDVKAVRNHGSRWQRRVTVAPTMITGADGVRRMGLGVSGTF
jgi:hypothetical protein